MFKTVLNDMLIDENNHKENEPLSTKRNNERKKEKNNFMEFICNILSGYDEAFNSKKDEFEDSSYKWEYGGFGKNNSSVKTYSMDSYKVPVGATAASSINDGGNKGTQSFAFRTAESFLNSLTKKKEPIDISKYEQGQRVFHKKFGEGTITKIEPEGDDLKVEIAFDKSGNKRLMAKYAGLEII